EMEAIAEQLAQHMALNKSMARMDSLMVASSSKKMSRLELVYTVVRNIVQVLDETDGVSVPQAFVSFLQEEHKNDALYRTKYDQTASKLEQLIQQASNLFQIVQEKEFVRDTEAFHHLKRLLEEQCTQGE